MLPIFTTITDNEMTSSATSMDISESFRAEDLSKTDFFDFVSAPPEQDGNHAPQNNSNVNTSSNDQPLQGFDQFWGAEKETQQRLESAIFEDLNRYCWNQQNAANVSISSATTNGSNNNSHGSHNNSVPQVLGNSDGQIYTITVLNSSSADQWLRKDISSNNDQPSALDINLDTILSNYPYVKTECFSYDDSGFGTAESTKEDINYQHPPTPQLLQPQSTGVTTTSVLLESNLSATSDLISYTDMSNNNNEWNIDRNEIKDWETCEANESPESLLRSALQGKGYAKTLHSQNGITVIPAQNLVKDEELRRALFTNEQETLTFADSTLSNSLFDDSQTPQSTLSQHVVASGVVDDMFLTLDNAFTDEFEKMKRIANEVQHFCTIDSQGNSYGEVITIENNAINTTPILTTNDLTNNNSSTINNNNNTGKINKNRGNGAIKTTKKYKKSLSSSNMLNNNNDTSTINNNLKSAINNLPTASSNNSSASVMVSNANSVSPGSGTVCNGIRKERSLHYCSICSKGFKDKYSVNVHHRTHTGEKPFSCSLCGKNFRQKAHLAKHYQTHLQKSTSGSSKSKHHQKQPILNAHSQPIAQTSSLNVINV